MIKTLILSSLRALTKSKSTSLLNIMALSLGIAACTIAYLHIQYELSFDTQHTNGDRIYRVVTGDVANGEGWVKVSTPIPPKLKAEIPEVEKYARLTEFSYNDKVAVAYDEIVFNENAFYLADQELFELFDFETIKGINGEQLEENTIAISDVVAAKYFGKEDPIGKVLRVDSRMNFEVVCVYKKLPDNNHFDPDFIIPFSHLEEVKPGTSLTGNWGQFNYYAYVLLSPNADPIKTDGKIKEIVAEYGDNQSLKFESLAIQALSDIHFQQNRGNIKASYDPKYLYIYGAIAFAILLISFINFMNLNVATSTRRIKEVGVRKVLGASKAQLTAQFVTESIILAIVAAGCAMLITKSSLPAINNSMGTNISFNGMDAGLIAGLIVLISAIALSSGIYISLYILSFKPVVAVKGVFKIGNRGKNFKEALLSIQFAVSCVLILSSLFIYQQLSYIRNFDIGMNQEGIMTLQLYDESAQEKADLLIAELNKLSGVESVSGSRFTPGSTNWHQTVRWDGQTEDISWNLISIDENFIETYGIKLTEGSLAEIKNSAEHRKYTCIINQAALKETPWEYGLGNVISAFGESEGSPISAVVEDFNYKSLHTSIEPCILYIANYEKYSQVSIRYSTDNLSQIISDIQSTFMDVLPETPFEYAFLDDQLKDLYIIETQTSQLVGLLTIVAVALALMGVYALLSFTIRERTKEIAIRKVLGIEMKETIVLLSKSYIKLLLIGNIVGIAATWYTIQLWLQNFSYQIDLGFLNFILVPVLTLALILLVVGIKTRQVESINPIEALHYE